MIEERIVKFPPFRGRSIRDGHMTYGCLLNQVKDTEDGYVEKLFIVPPEEIDKINGWAVQIRPETLGRFSGLQDCENTPIYEGDVIDSKNLITGEFFRFVVMFGECGDRRSMNDGGGYMACYFQVIDGNNVQKAALCRTDPLYWLNHTRCTVMEMQTDRRPKP